MNSFALMTKIIHSITSAYFSISSALNGQYESSNPEIKKIREEISLDNSIPNCKKDRENMKGDMHEVAGDLSRAFKKYKLEHP